MGAGATEVDGYWVSRDPDLLARRDEKVELEGEIDSDSVLLRLRILEPASS
jgi:hypothetical protein